MLFMWINMVAGTRRHIPPDLRIPILKRSALIRFWGTLALLPVWLALSPIAARGQGSSPGSSPAPFAGAVISEWKGEVHIQLPAAKMSAPKRGQVLPAGSVLETGEGRLVLVLRADESEILVQPHTRVIVSEPAPGNWDAVILMLGRVRAYIRKRTGGTPPFQMGTPSAVIAVRGTRFDVEVNGRGVSEVDVFDGLVEVASVMFPGSSVLVSPGFSTRVAIGSAPEAPMPTQEIRPGVEAPEQMAKMEFFREQFAQRDRFWESEFGERPDSEVDEAVDESRESEKGKK